MRAVEVTAYGGPEVLELRERPRPEPGPGEVRVAVEAAGLNFADVEKRRGEYPDAPEPPFVPGMEAAGRVDAVGEGVDRAAGERVVCLGAGTFAEYTVVPADRVFEWPGGLDAASAAGVPVQFLTAHSCLHDRGGVAAGETVLVFAAAGGVGSAAVQLAREAGATVVGAAGADAKLGFVRGLGADRALNYERADVADALAEFGGADLALDGVGGGAFRSGLEALADGGRIVSYGMASGRPGSVATPRLFFHNRSVLGYHLGTALDTDPGRVRAAADSVAALLESGAIAVRIDEEFGLDRAGAAYERLERRSNRGKVVVRPS